MDYNELEDEFQQSGGGWWIRIIGIIVYILVIVAYAVQTLQLVTWLFPADNMFMRIVTVFVCDGCATGYAMTEMFYRFRLRKSKHLTFGMWVVTFILSTAATVIQMYLSSTHNIPHAVDPSIIGLAYGLIIVAFVVNIVAITVIIRMEHSASQPRLHYLDDRPRRKAQLQPAVLAQTAKIQQVEPPTSALPQPAAQDENARLSALVAELKTLVASGKANGENFSLFGGDLAALVNDTPPDPQTAPLDQANQ